MLKSMFAAALFGFMFFQCKKDGIPPVIIQPPPMDTVVVVPPLMPSDTAPIVYSYLALGDSYTIGQSVANSRNFPNQLVDSLAKRNFQANEKFIIAQTGWRTDNLKNAIVQNTTVSAKTYDLVTLLIGVNNQYQNRPIAQYEKEFEELLQTSIGLAGGDSSHVIVVSIPDYAYTPFGNGSTTISTGIDQYNAINASITAAYGIAYVDITDISRRGIAEPNLVASDGLHPSAEQYSLWVERILVEANDKLE